MQLFDGAQVFTTEMGGKPLTLETGVLAAQAGGAVTVRYGDTVILATATMSKDVRPDINFFPLTVEFEERLYAAGRIPGSFQRREGRPSEDAILIGRL
ncbi:MAG: polyribonucleotide nucleotidyltransferase, partial [Caldilineaceae bacterium]